ncbi:MAG: hypothetical protein M3092_02410 [Actinomycetia bacterium]|nr:hypothetical protein [Actinomycetes bacterium]
MTTASETQAAAGFGSVSLPLKISGGVSIAVGVVFIVVVMMNSLFAVGPAFEEMIDDFRPILTDEALGTASEDIAGLEAVGVEFQTAVVPGLAQTFGVTPEEFSANMAAQYPDIATGLAALPEITATFNGLIGTLDSQQELFASADAIPTTNLPANTVPWIVTLSGLAAIAVGVMMFMPGKVWSILAIVLGATLVITTFALNLPAKAADADQLNANLTPIYTQELIDGANQSLVVIGAMGNQMATEMIPDLAAQLGMSQEELGAFLGENFPATAAAIQTMPETLERFEAFVGVFEVNLENYETIQPVAFSPIIWMMVVGGAVILIMGTYCLIKEN